MTDAAVIALADKCYKCCGLTRTLCSHCGELTGAAVLALAAQYPEIMKANFRQCGP